MRCGVPHCAPYTVLDLPGFLNSVARLAGEYRGPTPYAEPAWLLYLKYLLRHALGWPALLLAGGGMCLGIVRLIRGPGYDGRLRSVRADRDLARAGTVDLAYSWIIQNIPSESDVVLEQRAILLP